MNSQSEPVELLMQQTQLYTWMMIGYPMEMITIAQVRIIQRIMQWIAEHTMYGLRVVDGLGLQLLATLGAVGLSPVVDIMTSPLM